MPEKVMMRSMRKLSKEFKNAHIKELERGAIVRARRNKAQARHLRQVIAG